MVYVSSTGVINQLLPVPPQNSGENEYDWVLRTCMPQVPANAQGFTIQQVASLAPKSTSLSEKFLIINGITLDPILSALIRAWAAQSGQTVQQAVAAIFAQL